MNHKHSFLTRGLALLLALVLVLSNANIGLTMRLQAAERGNLFELIADSNVGNKELNAVLNYADALYNVNDEKVNCPAAPEAADATLISGVPAFRIIALVLMVAGGIGGGIVGRKLNKKMDNRAVDKLFIALMCLIIAICVYNAVRAFS